MKHKYVNRDGSLKELTTEENELFDRLIRFMKMRNADNFEAIEELISDNPFLCRVVHGEHGYTALTFAIDMSCNKGWRCFEVLLQNGANIYHKYQGKTLMQRVLDGTDLIFTNKYKYKHIAYDYANNDRDRAELNLLRFQSDQLLLEQQKITASTEKTPESDLREMQVVVKESGGDCCIVSILTESRYYIEIYNHPKFSVMLKTANDLGVLRDFMSALEDNYFAEQLPIAIEEAKQELINYQRSMGANEEALEEIDSAIEDISIEQVLSELYSTNEQQQERKYSLEEFFNDMVNALRLVALNGFITLKSGHIFYHGFPGSNPDDFGGNSGGAGTQSEKFSSDNATAVQMVLLSNYTNFHH